MLYAEKAIEFYGGAPDAYVWATLGIANYRSGRWDAALIALKNSEREQQLTKRDPGVPLRLFMAVCHYHLDNLEDAQNLFPEFDPTEATTKKANPQRAGPDFTDDYKRARQLFEKLASESESDR